MKPFNNIGLIDWSGFDRDAYIVAYPDLATLNDRELIEHYILDGYRERRILRFRSPIDRASHFAASVLQAKLGRKASTALLNGYIAGCAAEEIRQRGMLPRHCEAAVPNYLEMAGSYLIIGNSNSLAFAIPEFGFAGFAPLWAQCPGAAIFDLHQNSKARYGKRIHRWLSRYIRQRVKVLFSFGQVGTDTIPYINHVREEPFQRAIQHAEMCGFIESSVAAYLSFLDSVAERFPLEISVAGAFPPSISDLVLQSGYVNDHVAALHSNLPVDELRQRLRQLEFPDLRERAGYARRFNDLLRQGCKMRGLKFVDVFSDLVTPDNLMRSEYIVEGFGYSDHLNFSTIAPVTIRRLREAMWI
jgi:hypothetical protein